VLFNPPGLGNDLSGSNCFIDCVCFHLDSLGLEDIKSKFLVNKVTESNSKVLIDVSNQDLINAMCVDLPFSIYASVELAGEVFRSRVLFRTSKVDPARNSVPT
jgi:hypothetical protein